MPIVSVFMLTYNHEAYIEQAILSVINQNVDFEIEIVVGEDCSTDATRNIVEQLSLRYAEIRLLPLEANIEALANYHRTLQACKGQYVAFLDGDDYWVNSEKFRSSTHHFISRRKLQIERPHRFKNC